MQRSYDVYFDYLTLWLDYTLKYNCNAFDEFNDSLNTSSRTTYNQQCSTNPTPVINNNLNTLTSSITGVSYVWYLNGSPIPNSNQISIVTSQPGNYEVEVFFNDGCSQTSAPYTIIATRYKENDLNDFKMYPNPTNKILNFKGINSLEDISIYNNLGQQMKLKIINNSSINISSYPKGLYFVNVKNNIKKLIIQ